MDIQAYISSGILESYILGTVSPQERQEVECMSHIYPEIREELQAVETALEALAMKAPITPPKHIKENLFATIENTPQEAAAEIGEKKEVTEAKVLSLKPEKNNTPVWKWVAAASIIGVGITSALFYNSNQKISRYTAQLKEVKTENALLEKSVSELTDENKATEIQLAFLSDKNTAKIILKGTEAHPETQSTVYWNPDSKKGFITVQNLPKPPSEQDYQLWAIVEGVPVDMGVVTIDTETKTLQKIPNVANAQAFAITLEKKGGSPTPNLSQLYVIGNT